MTEFRPTPFSAKLWGEVYAPAIEKRWGIREPDAINFGSIGNEVFEAEFREHGPEVYACSVTLPIRNAVYNCFGPLIDRYKKFFQHTLMEGPLLDFGCGVGAQLLMLQACGVADLWGWDVPGVQAEFTKPILAEHGIQWGQPQGCRTILCIHVLEHVPRPAEVVAHLRSLLAPGGRLYASCDFGEGHGHIAPPAELRAVYDDLHASGQLFDDYVR